MVIGYWNQIKVIRFKISVELSFSEYHVMKVFVHSLFKSYLRHIVMGDLQEWQDRRNEG